MINNAVDASKAYSRDLPATSYLYQHYKKTVFLVYVFLCPVTGKFYENVVTLGCEFGVTQSFVLRPWSLIFGSNIIYLVAPLRREFCSYS